MLRSISRILLVLLFAVLSLSCVDNINHDLSAPHNPASELDQASAAIGPEAIVFEGHVNGTADIFLTNPDGTGLLNLTNSPGVHEVQPYLHPNRNKLIYWRVEGNEHSLGIVSVDGQRMSQILLPAGLTYSRSVWSRDGKKLLLNSGIDTESELHIYNIETEEVIQLTHNDLLDNSGDWSPDGKWIVYRQGPNAGARIRQMRSDGAQDRELQIPPNLESTWPRYSPDGTQIVFSGRWNFFGVWDLFLFDLETLELTQLTDDPNSNQFYPDWSPDGTSLVYAYDQGDTEDLRKIDLATFEVTVLLSTPGIEELRPHWR